MNQALKELDLEIAATINDPVRHVWLVYPWGSGELTGKSPMKWQLEVLEYIRDTLKENPFDPIQIAVAAGHGPGKSALIAWLIKWVMDTRPDVHGVVTANTQTQLRTKTWRELAKWHRLAIDNHLCNWSPTGFRKVGYEETWAVNAVPNSPQNPDAFQGQHATYVLQIFDEASGIEDVIWNASDGAMTTGQVIRVVFGNPTRNAGRFYSCFHSQRHRWKTWNIDVRDCEGNHINHKLLNEWVEDYGEDSDYVRVRVRGQFPKSATGQFFRMDHIENAVDYTSKGYELFPLIMGVDIARNEVSNLDATDESVVALRQGNKLHELRTFKDMDPVDLAREIARIIDVREPEVVFIDTVGVGWAIPGILNDWGYNAHGVNNGNQAIHPEKYANRRVEMYDAMREWLKTADIPDDPDFRKELELIDFFHDGKNRWCLEQKRDLKKREGISPDRVDAVSMTFAERVVHKHEQNVKLKIGTGGFAWG